jgi:hypothetical protein
MRTHSLFILLPVAETTNYQGYDSTALLGCLWSIQRRDASHIRRTLASSLRIMFTYLSCICRHAAATRGVALHLNAESIPPTFVRISNCQCPSQVVILPHRCQTFPIRYLMLGLGVADVKPESWGVDCPSALYSALVE